MLQIENKNIDRIPEAIRTLRKENHIYIYGDGEYAEHVISEVNRWGLKVEKILVSQEYKSRDSLLEFQIQVFEEFIKKNEDEIVILAGYDVSKHRDLDQKILSNKCVKKIYALNGCNILFANHFKWSYSGIELLDNYYEGLIVRDLNYQYYKENEQKYQQTYDWLCDDKSQRVMTLYLDGHINLPAFPMLAEWERSDAENQYFPDDIIALNDKEVFVDCGAYTGDTLEDFSRRVQGFKRYYALEPDERRCHDIYEVINKIGGENVVYYKVGAWDKKDTLYFSQDKACGEVVGDVVGGEMCITVDSIDNIVDKEDKVTFVKMDIEGVELPALRGAESVIKRDKPTLAICVYHKREDLITIPQYIKELVPEYDLFLRCHFPYASELVLYAVYRKRED